MSIWPIQISPINLWKSAPKWGRFTPFAKISEHDKVWDTHRNQTDKVSKIYALSSEFERYSERLGACSGFLWFGFENGLKLKSAPFCHVRGCPVCQWRKSLFWKAMMYQTYDQIKELYPSHRWLFLTLTVENCPIGELRATLSHMNDAWKNSLSVKNLRWLMAGYAPPKWQGTRNAPMSTPTPIFMWYWWLSRHTSLRGTLSTWIGLGHGVSVCGWTTCPMWTFAPLSPKPKT